MFFVPNSASDQQILSFLPRRPPEHRKRRHSHRRRRRRRRRRRHPLPPSPLVLPPWQTTGHSLEKRESNNKNEKRKRRWQRRSAERVPISERMWDRWCSRRESAQQQHHHTRKDILSDCGRMQLDLDSRRGPVSPVTQRHSKPKRECWERRRSVA